MALETVSTIYDLVAANPSSGDPLSQADDHLRNIKAALLASFDGSPGGYQKLGKIIVQWGTATTNGAGVATFTYLLPFPTSFLSHQVTYSSGALSANTVTAGAGTTTQSTAYLATPAGVAVAGGVILFFVIGY